MNNAALRAVLVFLSFILLLSLAFYLHREEPDLKKSEIIKIISSGLVIIGIMYSILTYESNKVKIRHDIRVNKCSATFKAIGEWYVSPMLDHIKICKDFECKKEYQLLKNDIAAFIVELEKPVNLDYRKSLFCIFNYFESTALAVNEGLMDELFIKKYFRGTFFEFYDAYFLFIEIRRKIKNDQEIFSEFTNLVNKWKS